MDGKVKNGSKKQSPRKGSTGATALAKELTSALGSEFSSQGRWVTNGSVKVARVTKADRQWDGFEVYANIPGAHPMSLSIFVKSTEVSALVTAIKSAPGVVA